MIGGVWDIQTREPEDTISGLNRLTKTLQRTIEAVNACGAVLYQEQDNLKEQMGYPTKRLFGVSSKKGKCSIPGQLNLSNEAETVEDPVAALLGKAPPSWEEPRTRLRKKRVANEERLEGLPAEQVFLDVPEEERVCGVHSTLMETIGTEFVRRGLKSISAKVRVIGYYSVNYGCPKYYKEAVLPQVKKGKGSRTHRIHGMVSTSIIAWVMCQKYFNGMPLHRQERGWRQCGTNISRITFANWIIANAQDLFTPMHAYFRKKLLARSLTMADETPVQVPHEPGRRAQTQPYMWLFRNGEDEGPPIILCRYAPTRTGDNAVESLEGCNGYLVCDGYSGYNKVLDTKRTTCQTHIRRYLIDAIPKGKQLDYTQPSVQEVMYVSCLFKTGDKIRKRHAGDYEVIRKVRLEKERSITDGFSSRLEQQKPTRGSRLDKVTTYTRNRESYLFRYLGDGRCSLSNNLSEDTIRPFVIGRKGWLSSDTPAGAETSTVIYTMVENTETNGVNVYQYLKLLLERQSNNRTSGEESERFAPRNPEMKALLDSRVTDKSENGRIPRGISRYLAYYVESGYFLIWKSKNYYLP